tara:strand:+ start:264 stop:485 length:222 start_codon:yes stop_codon:yes gene_type:complete
MTDLHIKPASNKDGAVTVSGGWDRDGELELEVEDESCVASPGFANARVYLNRDEARQLHEHLGRMLEQCQPTA